jgi:hypothetical protein
VLAALLGGLGFGGGAQPGSAQLWGTPGAPDPLSHPRRALSTLPAPDTLPGSWREGGNPAGLPRAGFSGQSHFRIQVGGEAGAHRRVQDPARRGELGVGLEGHRSTGGWHSAGAFHYRRRGDDDVRWSSVSDPFSGSPYIWSDSTGGDWGRDDVLLMGQLGSPRLPGGLLGGVALSAIWGQGARRNDPRPLFRIRDLELVPGLELERGTWTMGFTGHLGWVLEEGEIGYFAGDDPFVYRFRGYGTFDRTQLVRATRTREGGRVAGGFQVARRSPSWGLSGAARMGIYADSIRQGIARPEYGGGYRRVELQARAALRRMEASPDGTPPLGPAAAVQELRWAGWLYRGEGTDPVFLAVNTEDLNAGTTLELSIPLGSPRGPSSWQGSLLLEATEIRREDIAADTRWSVSRAGFESGVRWTAHAHDPARFQLHFRGGFMAPVAERWEAGRETLVTPILVRPDFDFTRTSSWLAGGEIGLTLPISPRRTRVHLALEASIRRTTGSTTSDPGALSRSRALLTLSLLPQSP